MAHTLPHEVLDYILSFVSDKDKLHFLQSSMTLYTKIPSYTYQIRRRVIVKRYQQYIHQMEQMGYLGRLLNNNISNTIGKLHPFVQAYNQLWIQTFQLGTIIAERLRHHYKRERFICEIFIHKLNIQDPLVNLLDQCDGDHFDTMNEYACQAMDAYFKTLHSLLCETLQHMAIFPLTWDDVHNKFQIVRDKYILTMIEWNKFKQNKTAFKSGKHIAITI
jgi:hypothetical protein